MRKAKKIYTSSRILRKSTAAVFDSSYGLGADIIIAKLLTFVKSK